MKSTKSTAMVMMVVASIVLLTFINSVSGAIAPHHQSKFDQLHDFAWAHHAKQESQLKMASGKPMYPHGMSSAPSSSLSLQQAVQVAQERKQIFESLLESDPESALSQAYRVPDYVRESLPVQVRSLMEEFISATGSIHELAPSWTQELLEQGAHLNWEDQYVALVDNQEYQIKLYGRRKDLTMAGGTTTHIHGVFLPGTRKAAVLDTPYRLVTSEEALYYRSVGSNTMQLGQEEQQTPSDDNQGTEGKIYALAGGNKVLRFNSLQAFKDQENKDIKEEFYARASVSYTNGNKKMLWIQISFPDKAFSYSTASINSLRDNQIAYYSDVSNGSTTFTTWEVLNINMPNNAGTYGDSNDYCGTARTAIDTAARSLVSAAGKNLNDYDRWLMAWDKFTTWGSCWAGLAYVGAKGGWINTPLTGTNPTSGWDVVAHEFGHNWSFRHANAWDPTGNDPTSSSGTMRAYYDKFDVMGYGGGKVLQMHFSTYNKIRGNWFDPSTRLDLTASSSSGIYRLYAMDMNNIYGTPRMIAFPKDAQRTCFIEFRQAIAPSSVAYNSKHGILVKWALEGTGSNGYGKQYETDLLDMRPWTSDQRDAILGLGASFVDTSNGLSKTVVITPVKIVPNNYVDVMINFGPFTGNQAPSVGSVKTAYSSAPRNVPVPMRIMGGSDPNGDTVQYYWDYAYSASGLSRYFGDMNADLSQSEYTSTGTKTIRLTASDGKTGTVSATTTVTITSGCNCNGHGTCTSSKCVCTAEWSGAECDIPVPQVASVNPATNVQTGGVVTVQGTNFTDTDFIRCKYATAGTSSWATYVSPTAVTCNVPIAGAGQTQETVTVSADTITYSPNGASFVYDSNSVPPTPTPSPTNSPGGDNSQDGGDPTNNPANNPTGTLTPEETGGLVGGLVGAAVVFACVGWIWKTRKDGGSVTGKFSGLSTPKRSGGGANNNNTRSNVAMTSMAGARSNAYATPAVNRPPPPIPARVNTAKALYAYSAQSQGELSLTPGDQLVVKSRGNDGWALVSSNGREGYVPANYITA